MPSAAQPVLALAFNNINKIDRVDCDQLSSLWTVFTKCAESLENGRRLENLSWRLWYRECQLNDRDMQRSQGRSAVHTATRPHLKRERTFSSNAVPGLSASVESASTVEERDLPVSSSPEERLKSQQHLTPDRFHQLVSQFGHEAPQEEWMERPDKLDVVQPTKSVPSSKPSERTVSPEQLDYLSIKVRNTSHLLNAEDTSNGLRRASSVVHGFHPSLVSVKKPLAGSLPKSQRATEAKQGKQMFFIDSSPSGSDVERECSMKRSKKKKSLLKAAIPAAASPSPKQEAPKKRRSFKEIVAQGSGYDSSPFDSDEDGDTAAKMPKRTVMESAIMSSDDEDEDQSNATPDENEDDWASVCTESRANSFTENNTLFNKMQTLPKPRPAIASRKSLLSTLFTDPTIRLSNAQSRSSPAIAQSRRPSPVSSPPPQHRRPNGPGFSATNDALLAPGPVTAAAADIKGSISPRTTRRNMLATELSESLRKHLLWERRQKPANANNAAQAVLKRRHTAFDMTQLTEFPTAQQSGTSTPRPDVPIVADAGAEDFGYNGCGW